MGALTSKTYAFTARVWEVTAFNSIDILNGFCSNIVIESRGLTVMRVLPKYTKEFNSWLPDRIRVIYDSFNYNKIYNPYIKYNKSYITATWKSLANILVIVVTLLNLKNAVRVKYFVHCKRRIINFFRNFGFIALKGNEIM
jgi:NADH dehydrogenase/NADH:ubiquinone oxidoreductase subunit G